MKSASCGGPCDRRIVGDQRAFQDASSLDALGVSFGSSLSSRERDLLGSWEGQVYARQTPGLDVLQIGVGHGGSVRTWAAWYPDSQVTGLDVRRIDLRDLPENVEIIQGDQTDTMLLGNLCRHHQFDLVIDDGSDEAGHKLHTFLNVFPWLAPEARYICVNSESREAFGKIGSWQNPSELPTTVLGTWFGKLAAALVSGVRPVSPLRTPMEMVLHRARRVTFFPGSVIVQARP